MKLFKKYFLLIICFLFFVVYSSLSIIHQQNFLSGGFDLGIYDQSIWQYSNLLYPFNTIKMKMILGDHLALTLPLLAPLYWLWNDVRLLLLFQAAWISFSGIAIFKYLQVRKFTFYQSVILTFIYLLFYGIQFAIYFDFHPVIIGVGLLAWILYFWQVGKWRLFTASTILLLLTQENMGIALSGLAAIWFFQGQRRKLAILLGIIGIVSSFAAFEVVKFFAGGSSEYQPSLPRDISGYVTQFFDSSEKREVWLYSLSWYSFLPLFSIGAMLAFILDLSQYFLTGDAYSRMWSPFMHHRAVLSIFLLVGAADVLLFLKSKKINITHVILAMLAVVLFLQWHFHFALNKLSKKEFVQTEAWIENNREVLAEIPTGASVAAQQSLVPHLSHRKEIYLIYPSKNKLSADICPQKECWWLNFSGSPEYLVVDMHQGASLTMLLADLEQFREAIATMERAGAIREYKRAGDAVLYKVVGT